jgi:tetratricopeptide (TPR) repeat protein
MRYLYCFTNRSALKGGFFILLLLASATACTAGGRGAATGQPAEAVEAAPADPEVMARVWAAEAAGAEGDLEKAAQEYLAASFAGSDPAIARRATEVAISAQSWQLASMAADRWVVLEPGSVEARKTAARALIISGDYVQAEFQLAGLLDLLADQPWGGWRDVAGQLTAARDAERSARLVEHLVTESDAGENPYALLARSQVSARGGDVASARALAEQALAAAPGQADLHIWAGRLALTDRDPEQALKYYQQAWRLTPGDREHTLAFAELLRQNDRGDEANEVLSTLPDTPENRFVRIAIASQTGRSDLAEELYAGFATVPYSDQESLAFHAARSAELLNKPQEAIGWYEQLQGTSQAQMASMRSATLMAQTGDMEGAQELLRRFANGGDAEARIEAVLVEAQLLNEAGRPAEAVQVLTAALEAQPEDARLRYSRALISLEVDEVEQAVADLRQLLDADPMNPTLLNALGYTLADRTLLFTEAEELIRAAYELDPQQAAIIDSMGWIAYRQGRLEEAETWLRKAFLLDRNAEIAAHLGEVLWVQNQRRDAIVVWAEGLKIDPNNRVLVETLNRLGVSL